MREHNDPFYFALPLRSPVTPDQARSHIAETFKVSGRMEHVRSDDFHLFRIVGA
jgi:hypothetical protein